MSEFCTEVISVFNWASLS